LKKFGVLNCLIFKCNPSIFRDLMVFRFPFSTVSPEVSKSLIALDIAVEYELNLECIVILFM